MATTQELENVLKQAKELLALAERRVASFNGKATSRILYRHDLDRLREAIQAAGA